MGTVYGGILHPAFVWTKGISRCAILTRQTTRCVMVTSDVLSAHVLSRSRSDYTLRERLSKVVPNAHKAQHCWRQRSIKDMISNTCSSSITHCWIFLSAVECLRLTICNWIKANWNYYFFYLKTYGKSQDRTAHESNYCIKVLGITNWYEHKQC